LIGYVGVWDRAAYSHFFDNRLGAGVFLLSVYTLLIKAIGQKQALLPDSFVFTNPVQSNKRFTTGQEYSYKHSCAKHYGICGCIHNGDVLSVLFLQGL
jgi:hypothetical protein